MFKSYENYKNTLNFSSNLKLVIQFRAHDFKLSPNFE